MRRSLVAWGAAAAAVALLLLWDSPGPERTYHQFMWHEPGLHDHLAAHGMPDGVRRYVLLAEPDPVLADEALSSAYGGHRLERVVHESDVGADRPLRLALEWGRQPLLAAQVPTGWEGEAQARMAAFLDEVAAGGVDTAAMVRDWVANAAPWTVIVRSCPAPHGEVNDEAGQTPTAGPAGPSGPGPGHGGGAEEGTGDDDGHGQDACEPLEPAGTRYSVPIATAQADPATLYRELGGLAAARVQTAFQGYGTMGRLLQWGDWAIGISVQTLVVDGPDEDPWHMLADRGDWVNLLISQREPVRASDAEGFLVDHLAALGFTGARVDGLRPL